MGVKPFSAISLFTTAALVCACSGRGAVTVPPAREAAAEANARMQVDAKLAAGYVYQITGTAHGVDVAIGKPATFTMGRGDAMYVKLVPKGSPKYIVSGYRTGTRTSQSVTEGCADTCDTGGDDGPGTPAPTPTPPPNYSGCASSGGATWVNDATGERGCTSRGTTKALTCGTWSWSSRGRGTLLVPGTGRVSDIDYVVDNGDGSCRIGIV